ncbi:MAG: UbiA-like polyprenyltransferase [Planctomycetota bacterium]
MSARDWLGLIRFSHTVFALPFAILAAFLAWSAPLPSSADQDYPSIRIQDIIGILLCMVLARSAAMAFNRLVDHDIDAANPRTAARHLPAGILSRRSVLFFTGLTSLGFVASTTLFLPNRIPLWGSLPVLAWLFGYSLAKRWTSSAHLWLGVALALSPLCVWAAIRGPWVLSEPADWGVPGLLATAIALWVAGFDIIYACQDADYDAKAGLHSIPATHGIEGALRIALLLHVAMLCSLGVLAWLGHRSGLGWVFAVSVLATAVLVVSQHRMVRPDDLSRVNEAFFQANATISVILLAGGVIDCYV